MTAVISDLREHLQGQLTAKQSSLNETEDQVRRYVGERALLSNRGRGGARGGRGRAESARGRDSFSGGGSGGGGGERRRSDDGNWERRRTSLADRLGEPLNRDREEEDAMNKPVLSRVIKEVKSRDEALSEQVVDKKVEARNKRLFGALVGTLQKFSMEEKKKKDMTQKKKEVEQKIDEKTEKEKEDLKNKRRELLDEQRQKKQDIRVLQAQMKRVEEYETWENAKKQERCFIKTEKGKHQIYWMPASHTSRTHSLLQASRDKLEKEIEERKEMFEQELVEIEQKLKFDRRRLGELPGKGEEKEETKDDEVEGEEFLSNRRVVEREDKEEAKMNGANGHAKEDSDADREDEMEDREDETGDREVGEKVNKAVDAEKEKKKEEMEEEETEVQSKVKDEDEEERRKKDESRSKDKRKESEQKETKKEEAKKNRKRDQSEESEDERKSSGRKRKLSSSAKKDSKRKSRKESESSSSDDEESDSSSSESDHKSSKRSSKKSRKSPVRSSKKSRKRSGASEDDKKKRRRKDESSSDSSEDSDSGSD